MDAIHSDDRERVREIAAQLPTKGEYDLTYRIVWPDGSIRWIRDRAFPVRDGHGKLVRIAGLAEDITEPKRTEQQLENFADMLEILSNRLFEVQEEERRHLARELHYEIRQSLTAAKLEIEAAKQLYDPAAMALRLDDGLALIDQLLQSVRALSLDLRPALFDEVGLAAALRAHVQSHAERGGLAVRLAVDESLPRCDAAIEIACFSVAQEVLTNVLRHARENGGGRIALPRGRVAVARPRRWDGLRRSGGKCARGQRRELRPAQHARGRTLCLQIRCWTRHRD